MHVDFGNFPIIYAGRIMLLHPHLAVMRVVDGEGQIRALPSLVAYGQH